MDRIPILRMGQLLLVTIQLDMHDQLAVTLQDDLTNMIAKTGARGVLIDISALDVVDSFIGRMLANIAQMSRVLDASTVVTGMQPAVAITLVELGMRLEGVRTALTVERGMAMLRESIAASELVGDLEDSDADPDLLIDDSPANDHSSSPTSSTTGAAADAARHQG